MIKIGIDLNGVVRDINRQYLKYYVKDINPEFDDDKIDKNVFDITNELPFDNKSDLKKFIYEDYPYEIFGCAAPMSRNLHTFINGWLYDLKDDDRNEYEVSFFSLNEEELSIQSTYFYLSKSGSRVRNMFFPQNIKEVFDRFDVIITANPLIMSYPNINTKIISIFKNDNKESSYKFADLIYDDMENLLRHNNDFLNVINNEKNKNKFKKYFKKIFFNIKNIKWWKKQ